MQNQSGEQLAPPVDFHSGNFKKSGNDDDIAPNGVTISKFYDNNQN